MPKTKTVSEQTIHGEVEYSVIECSSCGQDVMEDEANEFILGDREGYACDACVDEGPAGFPDGKKVTGKVALVFALIWPFVSWIVIKEGGEDEFSEMLWMWIGASVGAMIWTLGIIGLAGVL